MLPAASRAWAMSLNAVPAGTHEAGASNSRWVAAPITLKAPLRTDRPPLSMVKRSPRRGWEDCTLVLLTPATKSLGGDAASAPAESLQLAGPVKLLTRLLAASRADTVTVNGVSTLSALGRLALRWSSGPTTLKARLVPLLPEVMVMTSLWNAVSTCATVVLTPLTKSAGAAGKSAPERSLQVAGAEKPLKVIPL